MFMDKKEAVAEIKRNLKEKWKSKLSCQKRPIKYRSVFSAVQEQELFWRMYRHNFAMMNQLLTGPIILNQHRVRIDNNSCIRDVFCLPGLSRPRARNYNASLKLSKT